MICSTQRRVDDARQGSLAALAKDRGNADLLELLADFYEQTQRPDEVAGALARCIEVEPGRAQAYFALAATLEQLGGWPRSSRCTRAFASHAPTSLLRISIARSICAALVASRKRRRVSNRDRPGN